MCCKVVNLCLHTVQQSLCVIKPRAYYNAIEYKIPLTFEATRLNWDNKAFKILASGWISDQRAKWQKNILSIGHALAQQFII